MLSHFTGEEIEAQRGKSDSQEASARKSVCQSSGLRAHISSQVAREGLSPVCCVLGGRHSCPLQCPPWESGSITASPSLFCFSSSSGHTLRSSPRPDQPQEAPVHLEGSHSPGLGVGCLSRFPGVCKTSEGPATLLTSSCTALTFCRPSSAWPRGCRGWETAPMVMGPCTGQLGDRDLGHQVPLPPQPRTGRLSGRPLLTGQKPQLSAGPRCGPQRMSGSRAPRPEVLLAHTELTEALGGEGIC